MFSISGITFFIIFVAVLILIVWQNLQQRKIVNEVAKIKKDEVIIAEKGNVKISRMIARGLEATLTSCSLFIYRKGKIFFILTLKKDGHSESVNDFIQNLSDTDYNFSLFENSICLELKVKMPGGEGDFSKCVVNFSQLSDFQIKQFKKYYPIYDSGHIPDVHSGKSKRKRIVTCLFCLLPGVLMTCSGIYLFYLEYSLGIWQDFSIKGILAFLGMGIFILMFGALFGYAFSQDD